MPHPPVPGNPRHASPGPLALAARLFPLLLLSACSTMNEDWSAFRGGPLHTGATPDARPLQQPELVWTFDTGGTVESSPSVVDGRLYCGTFNNHLFALDAETGEELWRFGVDGLVRASPSVVDGRVYFGADDDRFDALDAHTGEPAWVL